MQEVFKLKKSYFVLNIIAMISLIGLSVLFFYLASDTYHSDEKTFFLLFGMGLLITSIIFLINLIKKISYFIVVDENGINFNDEKILKWEKIEDYSIEKNEDNNSEKFLITFKEEEKFRKTKMKIHQQIEGYEYLKTLIKKHYEDNVLKNVDEIINRKG